MLGAVAFLVILAGAFAVIPAVVEILLVCAGLYLAAWLAVQALAVIPRRIYRYIEPLGPNGDLTGGVAVICWYIGVYIALTTLGRVP